MGSTRRICFTQNNWTEESYKLLVEEPLFQYVIIGKEVGESGTPHLQGYAEFIKKAKWGPLAKKHNMHCETAKGTPEQCINYCKKDGDYIEIGDKKNPDKKGQMEKDRWARNIKLAEEGKLDELRDTDPRAYAICYKTWKQMKQDNMKSLPQVPLDNVWIWGPPRIGKSTYARTFGNYYPKPLNKWWDGYQNEEVVVIDDFEKESHLDHHLKIWADHYDFIAECKGGSMRIRPKKIIVTSNYSPDECFTGTTLEAIRARFQVIHMSRPFN